MLKHVRIKNFKSLADVSVHLDPLTVLVGRSGTGKSNLVDALRFVREYVRTKDEAASKFGGWRRVFCATADKPAGNKPAFITFELTFQIHGIDSDFNYCLVLGSADGDSFTIHEESLSLGAATLFHHKNANWVHKPAVIAPPDPHGLVLEKVSGIAEIGLAHLVLANGLGCYDFKGDVLSHGNTRAELGRGFADDAQNYIVAFDEIVKNLQNLTYRKEIVAALRLLNPSILSVELEMPSRQRIVIGHGLDGRVLVLDLQQQSEGFRRFLAHLIALYQTPPKQTLIFEEPEKGIYPGALAVLADYFKACPDAGRGQVILTTHSPDLLDHFQPEQLRVVTMENFQTRIGPVEPEQAEAVRDNLMTTGELLTVDPARIAATASI